MRRSVLASSFRDPSGFVFSHAGKFYRQVNNVASQDYDALMQSGLYQTLVDRGTLIPHQEATLKLPKDPERYRILHPQHIPFWSYPYEWSFGQLKDAALATLSVQRTALEHGMILKDASPYNIQYVDGHPVLIDTLSFARYRDGQLWDAYRQFCEMFLAPLALMALVDVRLLNLLQTHLHGIPLDLASKLLPKKSYASFSLASHIHLHARSQRRHAGEGKRERRTLSKRALDALMASLEAAVQKLQWEPKGTEWAEYYDGTNYTDASFGNKKEAVRSFLLELKPSTVWDAGANTGVFSEVAADTGARVVAFDSDPAAIERLCRRGDGRILPLVIDITNPTPALGWASEERQSLIQRGPADTVMALALIHHLAITFNTPFHKQAEFFAAIGKSLIIEFVPKEDSNVQRLLSTREDIFTDYTKEEFERAFEEHFTILETKSIPGSTRVLYMMKRS